MRIKNNINILDFLAKVNHCQAEVYFETTDGDLLVLSSILSRYIFCTLANEPQILTNGTIRFQNPIDQTILAEFLCE